MVSNEGNSDTPASPGSSLDDDSDPDESGPRFPYAGLRSVRQAQLLRGQMSNKRVASQKAIKALQNVEIQSLPENERSERTILAFFFPVCCVLRGKLTFHSLRDLLQ